jgi:hypothetical protein
MAERTLSEVLVDIAMSGLLVNNMFQRDDGRWQVNLRRPPREEGGGEVYDFGLGSTLVEAARVALAQAQSGPGRPGGKTTGTYVPRTPGIDLTPPPSISLAMLFKALRSPGDAS